MRWTGRITGAKLRDRLGERFRRKEQREGVSIGTARRNAGLARFVEQDREAKWAELTRREKRRAIRAGRKAMGQRNPSAFRGITPTLQRKALQKVVLAKLRAHEDPNRDYELPVYDGAKARVYARRARTA